MNRRDTATALLLTCYMAMSGLNGLAAEQTPLSAADETRVKRFLHPLPHELRLKGVAYRVPAQSCGIVAGADATPRGQQMVNDFRARWQTRFGSELQSQSNSLLIVAGLVKANAQLQKAAEQGILDARYLASRRNPEQAYTTAMSAGGPGVKVYVAANDTPGLYYALLTLEQLLTSHSTADTVVLPHAQVVDWPDIRRRGSWTILNHAGKGEKAVRGYHDTLRRFSEWKYNLAEAWHLFADKLAEDGTVKAYWVFPKEVIEMGRRYAVEVFPGTGHITGKMGPPEMKKRFPGAAGTPQKPERKVYNLCHSHPDTQEMLDQYVASIARQFDFVELWMTELEGPRGCCHCPKCEGNLRPAFIKETQHLMHAYQEAKKINPKFRIILGLTQGSYPHNLQMLEHIPKEVTLNFYNGKMTYRTYFQKYNLPPSAQEIQRRGYTMGSTPSPSETYLRFPFQTPQYCRLLCGEADDRHLDFVMSQFFPDPFVHDFNAQACAEFLWNSSGRTAEEFTAAWATRRGMKDPDEVSAIICMLEYGARGLHCNGPDDIAEAVAELVTGRRQGSSHTYRSFEFRAHSEMARVLANCKEAASRARKLGDPELLAGAELLEHHATILERYAWCTVYGKDKAGKAEALKTIQAEVAELRGAWDRWIKFKEEELKRCRRLDFLNGTFDTYMKLWEPVLGIEKSATSEEATALVLAQQMEQLGVVPLEQKWRFRTVAEGAGLTQKWFSAEVKDSSWDVVRSDKECGWEGQGFEGYEGYAWYRQIMSLPDDLDDLEERKHLILLFHAVDEDAEVYINGKKAFTHSHKTVGGRPGSTWDKPFCFDAKPFLDPDEENLIAVRVYNRSGMGGIWKPVSLISAEKMAKAKALVEFLAIAGEGEQEEE